ncbi:MAG: hypothetical protein LJE58_15900 [Thiogranum sp.]|jgi:ABC-type sugar transport system substrate-binding protein|nr:hypothetical protein [Thiogranum sp.]
MKAISKTSHREPAGSGYTRRAFLLSLLTGVAGAGVLVAGCAPPADGGSAFDRWSGWLLGATGNRDAVIRVGRLYLQAYPAQGNADALLKEIDRAIAAQLDGTALEAADRARVGAALERAVRSEYARGEVVMVAGWVLSVSEARAYAAVAVLSG